MDTIVCMNITTKYGPEIHARLVSHIQKGMSIEDAGDIEGIAGVTLRRWSVVHPAFRKEIVKAQKSVKGKQIETILDAGSKSWQASAWFLERRFHEEYGRKDSTDLTSKGKAIKGVIYMPTKKQEGEGKV
jgi:hypothetical protein